MSNYFCKHCLINFYKLLYLWDDCCHWHDQVYAWYGCCYHTDPEII